MKHYAAIKAILANFHEPWMSAADKDAMDREILRAMGKTLTQLNADIQAGVAKGYSVETQVYLSKVVIASIKNRREEV